MTALADFTDNELAVNIAHCKQELAAFESEVARRRSEQEAKALADYWRAHPELTPVKEGDVVLMPFDFMVKSIKTEVTGINLAYETADIRYWVDDDINPHYWVDIWLGRASSMRSAYLANLDSKEAGNG